MAVGLLAVGIYEMNHSQIRHPHNHGAARIGQV
jgi:hypothetical protein